MMKKIPQVKLNDGMMIPVLGFGTYGLNGKEGAEVIRAAVETGYSLIDSAFHYENEGAVGKAIRDSGVPRSNLIITSKLPGRHHQYKEVLTSVEESLYRTGLDYFDLYLIHWPNPKRDLYVEAWQGLIEAQKRGLVRSVGVCNFIPEYLERLIRETGVTPSINQVELHPYFNQEEQRKWDTEHGIVTESWSPVGRGSSVLKEPCILHIAEVHGKSAVQVILRWHIQLGAVPIPKAASHIYQEQNLDIFDFSLSDEEMKTISSLTREDGRNRGQDPRVYEEF